MWRAIRRALLDEVRKHGLQVKWMPPTLVQRPEDVTLYMTLEHLIARHLLDEPDPAFFFVQVGAHDGAHDPLQACILRYDLAGLLVEPQAQAFRTLRSTYSNRPRLVLRNVAVAERDETRLFYRVVDGPEWTDQLASFDAAIILRHDNPQLRLRDKLVCEDVQCLSFESLLADVNRVDLLLIDVEGYDATLIRLFDFDRWRPSIVQFEHRHLSRRDHDAAVRRLVEHGYRVSCAQFDTLAYRAA
jgi:FkbM family methyltransferase